MFGFGYIIIVVVILFAENTDQARMKIKVISIHPCELPPSKMDPDNPITNPLPVIRKLNRDTTVIDCNVTTKGFGPVQLSIRTYQLTPNTRNLMFKLEKLTCTNPMTFRLAKTFKVNMTKDCVVAPGNYHFENLNLDAFGWLLTKSTTNPGKYGYEIEFSSPKGVVSCSNIVVDVFTTK